MKVLLVAMMMVLGFGMNAGACILDGTSSPTDSRTNINVGDIFTSPAVASATVQGSTTRTSR